MTDDIDSFTDTPPKPKPEFQPNLRAVVYVFLRETYVHDSNALEPTWRVISDWQAFCQRPQLRQFASEKLLPALQKLGWHSVDDEGCWVIWGLRRKGRSDDVDSLLRVVAKDVLVPDAAGRSVDHTAVMAAIRRLQRKLHRNYMGSEDDAWEGLQRLGCRGRVIDGKRIWVGYRLGA